MNTDAVVGVVRYEYFINGKSYIGNDALYKAYNTAKAVDELKYELMIQLGADRVEIKQFIYM